MFTPQLLDLASMEVQNISFPDEDLDLGDLGGVLEWVEPEDVSQASQKGRQCDAESNGASSIR